MSSQRLGPASEPVSRRRRREINVPRRYRHAGLRAGDRTNGQTECAPACPSVPGRGPPVCCALLRSRARHMALRAHTDQARGTLATSGSRSRKCERGQGRLSLFSSIYRAHRGGVPCRIPLTPARRDSTRPSRGDCELIRSHASPSVAVVWALTQRVMSVVVRGATMPAQRARSRVHGAPRGGLS